mmetsp:Transcript_7619/g.23762  ORF Transcript_7619/g.23762 Transcript_7619/m.23762 type:complete len:231 (+) Transcript_7619:113-805(+)
MTTSFFKVRLQPSRSSPLHGWQSCKVCGKSKPKSPRSTSMWKSFIASTSKYSLAESEILTQRNATLRRLRNRLLGSSNWPSTRSKCSTTFSGASSGPMAEPTRNFQFFETRKCASSMSSACYRSRFETASAAIFVLWKSKRLCANAGLADNTNVKLKTACLVKPRSTSACSAAAHRSKWRTSCSTPGWRKNAIRSFKIFSTTSSHCMRCFKISTRLSSSREQCWTESITT